jgi:hypothetical protein
VIAEVTVGVPVEGMDMGVPPATRVLHSLLMVLKLEAGVKDPSPHGLTGLILQ